MVQSEQIGDDDQRQRNGELMLQIGLAIGDEGIDEFVHQSPHGRLQQREAPRRENFYRQAAKAGMLWRIGAGEAVGIGEAFGADSGNLRVVALHPDALAGENLRMLAGVHRILVAADDVNIRAGHIIHRRIAAQFAVELIWIDQHLIRRIAEAINGTYIVHSGTSFLPGNLLFSDLSIATQPVPKRLRNPH